VDRVCHRAELIGRSSHRLGVNTRVFHLGDYRRATVGDGKDVPDDYFFVNGTLGGCNGELGGGSPPSSTNIWANAVTMVASPSTVLLRNKILKKCRGDIMDFLNDEKGQVAIYDAVNALSSGRKALEREFAKQDVQVRSISPCRCQK
jgi:6-phosphofructo-2-kinase/fructose-2,6-biphosphatase 4